MGSRSHRSLTGHHDLLPAAESRGVVMSFMSPRTFLIWTFGRGTVLWRIWPAVLMHTLFATGVTILSMRSKIYLGIPNVMLTVLGVVIGFVISYRASSGYDRYWMGRSSWSDIMRNARTFTRLVWFHVPLRLSPKTAEETLDSSTRSTEEIHKVMKEKRVAIELTVGFVVALKHHLRSELGMYYEDLYDKIRPLHGHVHLKKRHHSQTREEPTPNASAAASTSNLLNPVIPPINSYGSTSIARLRHVTRSSSVYSTDSDSQERRPLLPSSNRTVPSIFSKISSDLIPFARFFRTLFSIYRYEADSTEIASGEEGGVQRQWGGDDMRDDRIKHRPRVAGSGHNLPLEILRRQSDWLSILEDRGSVPGTSLGSMIGCIATFEDSLATLERILTTPLPFVYSVHIRHTVWIYLFFLPFQLVDQFAWYTIPGVAIASFIYLGFLAAGEEIEQPFGYDENDLDLDMFCQEIVQAEADRLVQMPGVNVFLGAHHDGDSIKVGDPLAKPPVPKAAAGASA
ncbi:UPF0187-domain-containing protein [Dentipellis sp. KUC8613]|nr:UPF0187-domain-containing protein [Dentipellis sp. KUC8613]